MTDPSTPVVSPMDEALDRIARYPDVTQGQRVMLTGALRVLNDHPALAVPVAAALEGRAVELLTAEVLGRIETSLANMEGVINGSAEPKPLGRTLCVIPCEDCASLAECMIAGGA